MESLLEKTHSCTSYPEKSQKTEKKAKHKTSGWETVAKCSFDATKGKHDYYREIDCIEKLRKKLKDYTTEIINYKEKDNYAQIKVYSQF